jgi:hypothetical protein
MEMSEYYQCEFPHHDDGTASSAGELLERKQDQYARYG